jgi:transcriptional regulator with XRE-family HTH domain
MAKKKRDSKDIDFYTKIGEKIRNIRIEQNLTQKDIGNYLGISSQIIVAYEKGEINIPFYSIVKICEILDISLDYLVAEAGSMNEYIAKYKIDLEGVSLAFKHKSGFNDDPYEITELLKNIFSGEPHNLEHDVLELALVKDIFTILSINLKMEIPIDGLLDRDYRNNFIMRQIPYIYSSKNENAIIRLNWDVNLILFIFSYIDITENIETYKKGE